ncbi:1-deoxy-D-xylulose-5-phosphate synthase [Microbispora sp. KK1-11]|uniref:1-deoxy-D-xylulose-5-phosphate synthase n=1 Tax=Microbispora sp. KK1-11 TaxID=2053005 RepID=UPI001156DC9C|nr:1-deoxy-D-xylulose-5-phosphate synthase [Microbispora sp. KK1-11]TQS22536.1 1-deoxy-D-xylulose-5-phosphate synthase [Microbispora sp. KK1-11]
MTLLELIREPRDLRGLTLDQMRTLAAEIRALLVDRVSRTGGHLGPNLGVVELTLAVHRVFDSPRDRILFDTGHQAYVHKILTGRAAGFDRLRRRGGLSGYPSREESPHDVIENSHASTALSYADGLAKAYELLGDHDRTVVAVVGDGALTGGLSWEALNTVASSRRRLVIVLNDNGRSYAPTVGGLARHLAAARAGRRAAEVFERLGLRVAGPVDGHDLDALERALREAREAGEPMVVHCVTRKGAGYPPAERDEADHFHGIGVIDPVTGRPKPRSPSWTSLFAEELVRVGADRPDVVAISAAMMEPVGLGRFAAAYPGRAFDVGIAEQHAVASAVGMSMAGLHPVVAVYATFLNRAFDQVLLDAALHRAPMTLVLDRAGVTGEDGPSHNGVWDLSILQVVPGLRVAAPRDGATLRAELREALAVPDGPTVVRFPKGAPPPDVPALGRVGGADLLRRGHREDVLIVSIGAMAPVCLSAAERLTEAGLGVTVADPRWVKPVDPALVDLATRHRLVVTAEDNSRAAGAGSAFAQALRDAGADVPVREIGVPPRFLGHGSRPEVLAEAGLCPGALVDTVLDALGRMPDAEAAAMALAKGM